MKKYTEVEVKKYLTENLKKWSFENGLIRRDFEFKDFTEAFSFVTAVALLSERADHHPDWSNVYNKVSIALSTHTAGGVTQKDFDLALKIDQAYDANL
jgi:4a-hydroxytetrahydrobiopterin dehydratase